MKKTTLIILALTISFGFGFAFNNFITKQSAPTNTQKIKKVTGIGGVLF